MQALVKAITIFFVLITAAGSQAQDKAETIFIAGFEQSGYSSLAESTNPFLSAFITGPKRDKWWQPTGWGRIRLLSAPQPSTEEIVSTFMDPTGAIKKVDFTKVGQAIDFVGGPEFRFGKNWGVVAGFGATTPLSSQDVTVSYQVPAAGTVECSTMAGRFSVQNGYSPGLVADPTGKSCLQGGYSTVAFSNQDRSNFLLKYGAGFRTTYPVSCKATKCKDSYRSLDITFGQDAAVSGGKLRGAVFKLDGLLPIPTGDASWLYLFGSAYMRLHRNQSQAPLILQTASGVTIPSSSVIVLPLLQPNRDFYRLGVGLDLGQIFCSFSSSSCSKPGP